jgi:hypothetical protein
MMGDKFSQPLSESDFEIKTAQTRERVIQVLQYSRPENNNGRSSSRRTWEDCTHNTRRLGLVLDRLLQPEPAVEKGQSGKLECDPRDVEEEACPSQENTLSKVHPDCQALAYNLRVWTREAGPEGEHLPKDQNEKNNLLEQ